MDYYQFLNNKKHSSIDYGINPVFIPDSLFDFQAYGAEYMINKGRGALFYDTGLGKTLIELVIADNYRRATNKPVLIITPLAVAFQFIKEAEKFGIDDIEYSKTGKYKTTIVICNYERLDNFNSSDFDCVILDESSAIKNFDGIIKSKITAFLKQVKYRFLATATPSPNDYIELGTSSEALGYMGHMDMLSRFFKNNKNNVSKISRVDKARAGEDWYLKPHAENDFWQWVSSWSISARKPSDLGFSDKKHMLPELFEAQTIIRNKKPLDIEGQMSLFSRPAVKFHEIKKEVRATLGQRCEAAVNKASNHETSVYWCNLNDEAALLSQLDKSAIEIKGRMNIDEKEEILLAFSNGEIKKLITKPTITAFGLNWQHCNHTTYFPTYSYEQYYQAIRRFWRFGQKNPVKVDLIISDGQERIMNTLMAKKEKAIDMFRKLIEQSGSEYVDVRREFNKSLTLPKFIQND
jgi:SNF2 family DNA or RNA helicase